MPSVVLFMVGFAIAITINYPKLSDQKERVANYADNALSVVSMIFAAGVFTGILIRYRNGRCYGKLIDSAYS